MPLPNRVDPFGSIHAVASRGLLMGNRGGCFHRDDQTLKPTPWASRQWISCVLEFRGRHRKMMQPGRYTELFFLDEATALAAGHRPCYECRRPDAIRFRDALVSQGVFTTPPRAPELGNAIAGEMQARLKGHTPREILNAAELPEGAMFALTGHAFLIHHGKAHRWTFDGYDVAEALPSDMVERLTPTICVAALRGGYAPLLHSSQRP